MRDEGFGTVAELARFVGMNQGEVGQLVRMKTSPLTKTGEVRKVAGRVCHVLNATLEELFNDRQMRGFAKTYVSIEANEGELPAMENLDDNEAVGMIEKQNMAEVVADLSSDLKTRDAHVIHERFYNDRTLDDIAHEMGLSRDRVRQLEKRALREMRGTKGRGLGNCAGYSAEDVLV